MLSDNATVAPGSFVVPEAIPVRARTSASWLSGEVVLYITLGLVALALRVAALGHRPLDAAEANQALAAWQIAGGHELQVTGYYSPLLFLGNLITFALLGASDAWARLIPAVSGTALVLIPVLFRRWLGRWGALISAALFALSPTVLYYSRYLSSEIVVSACGLLALAGLMHFVDKHDSRYLSLTVVALALMLTAGPAAYSILLLVISFVSLVALSSRLGYSLSEWIHLVQAWKALGAEEKLGGRLLLRFALTVLLVGTGLLLYIPGFQAVIDQFSAWLAQIGPVSGGSAWYHHLSLLLFYEPLVLVFGAAGLALVFSRRGLFNYLMVYWAIVALYLYTLFGGKSSGDVLIALVPLTMLAGLAIGQLFEGLVREGSWEVEGLFLGIAAPVGVYALLQLSSFGQTGQLPYLWLTAAGLVLTSGLFVAYWLWVGPCASLRSLGLAVLVFLLLAGCGKSWRLNFINLGDPREIIARGPTHTALRDLASTLGQLSAWRSGDRHELPISIVSLNDPALKWYVRDFRDVHYTDTIGGESETPVYITPDSGTPASLAESYSGQKFALRSDWTPAELRGTELIKWWLYRQTSALPATQNVILWVQGGGGLGPEAGK